MDKSYTFLIVDTYYPKFLSAAYAAEPGLKERPYQEQIRFLMKQCFGTADFYSANLKKLGCEAQEIIVNNEIIQDRWSKENGLTICHKSSSEILRKIPFVRKFVPASNWLLKILKEQIKHAKPDVLYVQDLSFCPPGFLTEMKKYVRIIVGQIACPLPRLDFLKPYDLILTSFPHYVEKFRAMGMKSEYFKIGFDPSVLERVGSVQKRYSCTFVGGISPAHRAGTRLLEELARSVEIDFFGYGAETLDKGSPILSRHHGEVWGLDMYRALLSSKITINRHIDVAENYANNMRLFEATGTGALLITDYKDNLHELFEIGKELVAYRNVKELVDLIKYYAKHDKERETIAQAGRQRTLSKHTYALRMKELQQIIACHIQ